MTAALKNRGSLEPYIRVTTSILLWKLPPPLSVLHWWSCVIYLTLETRWVHGTIGTAIAYVMAHNKSNVYAGVYVKCIYILFANGA